MNSVTIMKGLAGIDMADIPTDGSVATTWTFIGPTEKDQAKLTEADATESEYLCNESDDPLDIDVTGGKKTIEFTIMDVAEDNLLKWFGGAVDGTGATKIWTAPATKAAFQKEFRIRSKNGLYIALPRVNYYAKADYEMKPGGYWKVMVKGTILTPVGTAAPVGAMIKGTISA